MTIINSNKHLFYTTIYPREIKVNIESTFKRRKFPTLAMANSFPEHESFITLIVFDYKLSWNLLIGILMVKLIILDRETHFQMVTFITFAVISSHCGFNFASVSIIMLYMEAAAVKR